MYVSRVDALQSQLKGDDNASLPESVSTILGVMFGAKCGRVNPARWTGKSEERGGGGGIGYEMIEVAEKKKRKE